MSDRTMPPVATTVAPARLEPDAISVAQDTLIGLADTGPTVSVSSPSSRLLQPPPTARRSSC